MSQQLIEVEQDEEGEHDKAWDDDQATQAVEFFEGVLDNERPFVARVFILTVLFQCGPVYEQNDKCSHWNGEECREETGNARADESSAPFLFVIFIAVLVELVQISSKLFPDRFVRVLA